MASVGAGWGCGGLCPRPLPRQGGVLGLGDFLQVGGRLGRCGGGRPWLHSGGNSKVYLVSLWALFLSMRSGIGWALVSSRVWPSGLSGALLPWSSSFWRCQTTRICGPPSSPGSRRRYWIVPSHHIQSPVWSLLKGCWTFAPFSNPGYASGRGGAGGGREDDEDAWSGWGGGNGTTGDPFSGRVKGCRTGFATNQANSKLTEPRPGKEGTTQASAQHVNCQLFRNLYQQHKSSPRDLSSQQFSPVQRCVCKQGKAKAIGT